MTGLYAEYLRRNSLVAKAIGARAGVDAILERLNGHQTPPPQWLVKALDGIRERVLPLPTDLAEWRSHAPDAPEYARAALAAPEERG